MAETTELTENEKLIEEKQSEIRGLKNLLTQEDWKAKKFIMELYKVIKAQFPNADTPIYDKYLTGDKGEQKMQEHRDRINVLEDEIVALGGTIGR